MMRPLQRAGVTLIELIVVLAVLGIIASVVPLTFRRAGLLDEADPAWSSIRDARRDALRLRRPVIADVVVDSFVRRATVMPDGRLIADSALGGQSTTLIRNAR